MMVALDVDRLAGDMRACAALMLPRQERAPGPAFLEVVF